MFLKQIAQLVEQRKVLKLSWINSNITSIGNATSVADWFEPRRLKNYPGQLSLTSMTVNPWVVGSNPTCFTKKTVVNYCLLQLPTAIKLPGCKNKYYEPIIKLQAFVKKAVFIPEPAIINERAQLTDATGSLVANLAKLGFWRFGAFIKGIEQ